MCRDNLHRKPWGFPMKTRESPVKSFPSITPLNFATGIEAAEAGAQQRTEIMVEDALATSAGVWCFTIITWFDVLETPTLCGGPDSIGNMTYGWG